MWETFRDLVLKGGTVRCIRNGMLSLGYDLSPYTDIQLLSRVLDILQEADNGTGSDPSS